MQQQNFKQGHWVSYNGEIFRLKSLDKKNVTIGRLEFTNKKDLVVDREVFSPVSMDDPRIRFFEIYIACRPPIVHPSTSKPIRNFPKLKDFVIGDRRALDMASDEGCLYLHEFQDWIEKMYKGATVNY